MKKVIVLLAAVALLSLGLCSGAFAGDTYKLKLGHTGAPTHHYQSICTMFAKKVAEKTGGKVIIDVFPADQLGKQLEAVEGTMMGTQDMVLASDTVLSNWVPDMGILNLPFLFNDNNDVRKVLDGPIGARLAKKLEPHGAVVIGWWDNGMRHITNNKQPIKSPADLKGMKIRVPEGEVFVSTFKALGAGPTVISFGELYSALQLGTVDGQENPPAHILTQKFYEVQKYVSRTGHIHLSSPLIMNKALLDGMPEAYRKAIVETAMEMGPVHTKMVEDLEKTQWDEVAAHGMQVLDVEKQPFREMVKPVIEAYKKKLDASIINDIEKTVAGKM
ncbi:MAG: TRAP transporter substrate-binding protein [Desulfovibrionaceae bacterium]